MGFKVQSSGGLPAGTYLAQVADFAEVEGDDFKDKTKKVQRFKWMIDCRAKGAKEWVRQTRYTGVSFTDPKTVSDPQFISGLTKLVDAMGLEIPKTEAELEEFENVELIGRQFVIKVTMDTLTKKLKERWERLPEKVGQMKPPAAAAPPPPSAFAEEPGRKVDADEDDWDTT